MENNYILVFVTTKDKQEAEEISQALLKKRLIACANKISPIDSLFQWLGKVDRADECLVVMKSRLDLFAELTECVKALHSYEVPEILALPIIEGSKSYLDWMAEVLK